MANKAKNINAKWVAARLTEVASGEISLSYYMLAELIAKNYLKPVFVKTNSGKGRPTKTYEIAARGSRLLALAKYWPKAA